MIPDRLHEFNLLKIYGPDHDCNHPGKEPVGSTKTGPFYHAQDPELLRWIEDGGNVGACLTGPFIAFDVDHDRFGEILDRELVPTFTTVTGSGGEHRIYHAPGWADNRQLKIDGEDFGSIRSDNWQVVVPPSVHPETGRQYRVRHDRPISSIGVHEIESVLEKLPDSVSTGTRHTANTARRRANGSLNPESVETGGGAACVGGSAGTDAEPEAPEPPGGYPNRTVPKRTALRWVESNGIAYKFDRTFPRNRSEDSDASAPDFVLVKCMTEGGFSISTIKEVMDDRRSDRSKWHYRGDSYRYTTILNAIEATLDDVEEGYVNFDSPAYKPDSQGERRKTETAGGNGGRTGQPTGTTGGEP